MFPDIPEQALVAAPEFVQPQIGFDRGFCARNSHHASGTFMTLALPGPRSDAADMNITTYGVYQSDSERQTPVQTPAEITASVEPTRSCTPSDSQWSRLPTTGKRSQPWRGMPREPRLQMPAQFWRLKTSQLRHTVKAVGKRRSGRSMISYPDFTDP